jgi:hypothetical protein
VRAQHELSGTKLLTRRHETCPHVWAATSSERKHTQIFHAARAARPFAIHRSPHGLGVAALELKRRKVGLLLRWAVADARDRLDLVLAVHELDHVGLGLV